MMRSGLVAPVDLDDPMARVSLGTSTLNFLDSFVPAGRKQLLAELRSGWYVGGAASVERCVAEVLSMITSGSLEYADGRRVDKAMWVALLKTPGLGLLCDAIRADPERVEAFAAVYRAGGWSALASWLGYLMEEQACLHPTV